MNSPTNYLHLAARVWETANHNPQTVDEWIALCEAEKLYDDLTMTAWLESVRALNAAA